MPDDTPEWAQPTPATATATADTDTDIPDWASGGQSGVPDWADQSASGDTDTPETSKALSDSERLAKGFGAIGKLAQTPSPLWLQNFESATKELLSSVPSMAGQFAKGAIDVAKFQIGGPQYTHDVVRDVLNQAIPNAAQTSKDIQQPVGSHDWWRGALQVAAMASPALDFLRGIKPAAAAVAEEKPPLQPRSEVAVAQQTRGMTLAPTHTAADVSRALERRFTLVDRPDEPVSISPAPSIEETVEQAARKAPGPHVSPETGDPFYPERDEPVSVELKTEGTQRIGGEEDAARIQSTGTLPKLEVRTRVGETTPLWGEPEGAPGTQEPVPAGESVAPATPQRPHAPKPIVATLPAGSKPPVQTVVESNVKGFEKAYGKGTIPPGQVLSPEEEWAAAEKRAQRGQAKPYDFVDRARTGQITDDEMGDLVYEHSRLYAEAAAAEGTPAYDELYNRAQAFAENVLKPAETSWARKGRVMQIKAPIDYSKLTGFRQALKARYDRDILPEERPELEKRARQVDQAGKERNSAVQKTFDNVINKRFKAVRDISFEDAVKQVHDELDEAGKPCEL